MLKSWNVVVPVIIEPAGLHATEEDLAVLNGVRLELMDWWAAFGHGIIVLEPRAIPSPRTLSAFTSNPHAMGIGIVQKHFPVFENADLTILFAIKGIDSQIITAAYGYQTQSYGAGTLQYALAAWNLIEGAKTDPEVRKRLIGLVAHELGHSVFGWQHDYVTPHNIMGYAWWRFPTAGMPGDDLSSFRLLSTDTPATLEPCSIPTEVDG